MVSELRNESNLDEEYEDDDDESSSWDDEDEEEEDEHPRLIHRNLSAGPPMRDCAASGLRSGEGPSGSSQTSAPRARPIAAIKDPKCKKESRVVFKAIMGPS